MQSLSLLCFFMSSGYCFSRHIIEPSQYNLFLSGLFLVLASLCRTEVLIVVPVVCLMLLTKKELNNSILFGFTASVFEFTRIIAKKFFFEGGVIGYENMEQKWHVTKKTISYVIFESPNNVYTLSSYNSYFFIAIFSAAILFIATKRPKYLVAPKYGSRFAPHISKSFIRPKIVPISEKVSVVNLEYLDLNFQLERVHDNEDFSVFLASYAEPKNGEILIEVYPSEDTLNYTNAKTDTFFSEIKLKSDQCVKPLIINSKGQDGIMNKFAYYHLIEGIKTIPLTQDYLSPTASKNTGLKDFDLHFQFKRQNTMHLSDCIELLVFPKFTRPL